MKTTKRTEYTCLACKHVKIIKKYTDDYEELTDCIVKCCAPNAAINQAFSAKYFYCIEYKGFGELTEKEIQAERDFLLEKYDDAELKKYAKTYIDKKDRKDFIARKRAERVKNY
jgi:hypothetical protein